MINLPAPEDPRRLEGRNGEIWLAYIKGSTQERIAEIYGISQPAVSGIIRAAREAVPPVDKSAALQVQLDLLMKLRERALEMVDMTPAPVFVGKDGAIAYDEKGEVVRDYSLRLRAIEAAARNMDMEARRLGLDAATKIESTGSVRFEIVGVDIDSDLR